MSLFTVGARLDDAEQPVQLDARRFNRHTFWVGQSGSGKTYALGVVLEQLLLHTRLPLLILDPNADFVRLGETRPGAEAEAAAQIAAADIRVLRSGDGPGERLHVRYLDLAPASKAAVLQLDPVFDAEEYNALLALEAHKGLDAAQLLTMMRDSGDPVQRRLAFRMENLQVLEWDLWAYGAVSAVDVIAERPAATVMDLGGFDHPSEAHVAALAVLERL